MAHFTYLYDPLCGWCYGASANLQWLRAQPGVSLRALPAGLFAWERAVPLDAMRAHIRGADERIHQITGEEFSAAYFDRVVTQPDGQIESGPATLAISILERRQPGRGLDLLRAIQLARYVAGRDVTDVAVLTDLAAAQGIAAADFAAAFADTDELRQARLWAAQGQLLLDTSGGRGVPTLLLQDGNATQLVPSSYLYHDRDSLQRLLAA